MKDKSLTVDGEGGISTSHCQCLKGKWICSIAAAAIFVNKCGHGSFKLLRDLKSLWNSSLCRICFPRRSLTIEQHHVKLIMKTGLSFLKNFWKQGLCVPFSGYLVQNRNKFKPITR